jgi:large subunit ribosomal protein L1
MKKSKRYQKAYEMIDRTIEYDIDKGLELLKEIPSAKFDETVEIHFNLGVDPRKADQQIRNSLILPHGTGKNKVVLVFAEGDKAEEAKQAGADFVGLNDLIEKIQSGWLKFDVAISLPTLMGKIGRLGRVLGPRGLMPNPKVGTVTMDVAKAVKDSKGGKIEYRVDKFGNIHVPAGKKSFDIDKLKENILTIVSAILRERPATVKGTYIKNISITTTMGPGIKLNVANTTLEAKK